MGAKFTIHHMTREKKSMEAGGTGIILIIGQFLYLNMQF